MLNQSRLNADVGFEMTDDVWTFGLAGQNLASLFRDEKTRFINTNIAYGMYRHTVNSQTDFRYGISAIQTNEVFQMEFNFTTYFRIGSENSHLQLGAFYRTPNEVGVMLGIDLSKNVRLYYNYDYNVGGISRSSTGSHEVMVSFSLDKIHKCNCWY